MDSIKYTLDRLDFNEKKLKEVTQELEGLRTTMLINHNVGSVDNVNIKQLLGDEKYRCEIAVLLTKNFVAASKLLNVSERTFYRKLKEYKIREELKLKGYE